MPQVFRIGSYWVYFWANEGKPGEPVHVHVSEGNPSENATKIWLTASGKCLLAHNNSNIPPKALRSVSSIKNILKSMRTSAIIIRVFDIRIRNYEKKSRNGVWHY